jgi:hypothetical protein
MTEETKQPAVCRCPNRPYASSWARDSAMEQAQLQQWDEEHGSHPYARARDTLAQALQSAEGAVHSGPAVLDMVHDVFGLPRQEWETRHVATDGGIGHLAIRHGIDLVVTKDK